MFLIYGNLIAFSNNTFYQDKYSIILVLTKTNNSLLLASKFM